MFAQRFSRNCRLLHPAILISAVFCSCLLVVTSAAQDSLTADQHFQAGIKQQEAGNNEQAIAHFTSALELKPQHSEARRKLGGLLLAAKRYIDASVLYGQLVESEPDNPDAHNDWGVVLMYIGNLSDAVEQFQEALRLKADHVDAHFNLAGALLNLGKTEASMQHLEQTLRIQPSYTDAHFTLGRAHLLNGKFDDAIAQFQHVLRQNREYAGLDYQLGRAYSLKGDLRKAVVHFSEAIRRDAYRTEPRFALGMALAKYGNSKAALAQFTEAVRLQGENADAHRELAQVLAAEGRQEEAIFHNNTLLTLRPNSPVALNNQSWLLATAEDESLRDPKRALELAERAKELADQKMPRILDTLAIAQAANGQVEQAKATAGEAAKWAENTGQQELADEIRTRAESFQASEK